MIDYSKWDHIEISDDEDDTHPNIDTASLNKWRHEARISRMAEDLNEKQKFEKFVTELEGKKYLYEQKKLDCETGEGDGAQAADPDLIQLENEIISDERIAKILEEKIQKKEKLTPLNVDTISQPGFSKTVVNKLKDASQQELSEQDEAEEYSQFVQENDALLKEFALLRKYRDTKKFLTTHPQMVSEHTANYLTMRCLEKTLLEKFELANHISYQCVILQFLFELAEALRADPKACVDRYFAQMDDADDNSEFALAFSEALKTFRLRVTETAKQKLAEAEEEEKNERAGPGGLDPIEVYESLPDNLKTCFLEKDIEKLQTTLMEMNVDEAQHHMQRCIDSGLWVPPPTSHDEESRIEENQESDDGDKENEDTCIENAKDKNTKEKDGGDCAECADKEKDLKSETVGGEQQSKEEAQTVAQDSSL